jgi:hypothetical protein
MKNPWLIYLQGVIALLYFAGCSGEDYDPSASNPDRAEIQGKVIERSSLPKPLDSRVADSPVTTDKAPPLEATSGESVGSLAINTLDESNGSVIGETVVNDDKEPEGEPSEIVNPLIGQNLPEIQSENEPVANGNSTEPNPPQSKLPPLPEGSPYKEVSFRSLSSFPYDVEWTKDGKEPDPTAFLKRVPPEVRKLSGAKVAVEGFMIPTMVNEDNKVTEFLLLPDQMSCCYGKNPAANGWVVVNAKGIDIMMDKIIRVTGSMFVEERWDEEFFEGLYHLDCEKVTGPAL